MGLCSTTTYVVLVKEGTLKPGCRVGGGGGVTKVYKKEHGTVTPTLWAAARKMRPQQPNVSPASHSFLEEGQVPWEENLAKLWHDDGATYKSFFARFIAFPCAASCIIRQV